MDAASIFLGNQIIKRIEEKRAAMLVPLISGALEDYAKYRHSAGYLAALQQIEDWLQEINARDDDKKR